MAATFQFKNQIVGEVVILPSWSKESCRVDSSAQTIPVVTRNVETQSTLKSLNLDEQVDKAVGTETHTTTQASMVGLEYVYDTHIPYNEATLASFLRSRKEECLAILHHNTKSAIFDNYEPNWVTHTTELTPLHTLTSPHAVEGDLHALGLSWNASGTMLAVAYGRIDTSGWCYHNGYVGVWNLTRFDLNRNNPHYTLETDMHATCVAFHPKISHMLAVGTYSGEVILVPDITEEIPTEYSTRRTGLAHHEPITALEWVQEVQEHREAYRYLLCSAAQDGQVMYWSPPHKMEAPSAVFGVPHKRQTAVGISSIAHVYSTGLTNLGEPPKMSNPILVGLENGEIGCGRTPLIANVAEKTATAASPLELDWIKGHHGPVQALSPSPFFRHLFLTCSSDGTVNLSHNLDRVHLLTLEPSADTKHFLYDAQFSPSRPSVVAVVSRSAFLHIYDLQSSRFRPVFSVEAGMDGAEVISTRFNRKSADLLATGDARGSVRVWKLPAVLTQITEHERVAIRIEQHAVGENSEEDKTDPIRALLEH
ncbi:unnamed protein product [Phytomonas sp. Hart1]|nr:unnamed protein product [Phytomonas sp. Hart1]|eukprot:CCW67477.1 unnamed protein product [Phytomonas sp. isolate Hart1]